MRSRVLVVFLLCIFSFLPALHAAHYTLDADHTTVSFKIRHILSWVQGNFREFQGSFEYDPEAPDTWKVEATIQAASIDTRVTQRDNHLRSKDFLEVETYPAIIFKSTGVKDMTPSSATLEGLLTIHGVEKPVALNLQIHGVAKDPWGNTRSAFTATTTINRKDFGLTWNEVLETGQVLVGEEVVITLEVEGILKT